MKDIDSKRRDKLGIIAEILEITKDGTLKTQIMYKASLSFSQLNSYLKFMIKSNLIHKFVDGGKEVYQATQKGLDFLQRCREIIGLLNSEDESDPPNGIKVQFKNCAKRPSIYY
jgi:predicted transcriptional regulator